jgi:hypothetical protein
MSPPRHRTKTARRRRRIPLVIGVAALVAMTAAIVADRTLGGGDRPDLVADRGDGPGATVAGSTVDAPSSTTAAPATTSSTAPPTTTSTAATVAPAPSAGGVSGWFAIVQSGPKGGTDREALADAIDEHGDRGHVIDTDAFLTGDGLEPEYYPAPGIYAAVVGAFASFDQARAWCTQTFGDAPCHARQLIPR